jgi:hypothetical protein
MLHRRSHLSVSTAYDEVRGAEFPEALLRGGAWRRRLLPDGGDDFFGGRRAIEQIMPGNLMKGSTFHVEITKGKPVPNAVRNAFHVDSIPIRSRPFR